MKGTIETLTVLFPIDLLIVSGGLVETIPVLVLFFPVTFAKREIVLEVADVFLVLIKLSSLTCEPLQVKLQSSHQASDYLLMPGITADGGGGGGYHNHHYHKSYM